MTQPPTPQGPAPARRRHLIDPDRPPAPPSSHSLTRVQQWVLSALAVTTILHLSAGLVIAALFVDTSRPGAQPGLLIIAGIFGMIAVAAGRAIHGRQVLSWWLLLGLLPMLVGFVLAS